MANSSITIPFYISRDGEPLTGASVEMEFDSLITINGISKIASAPAITEIGAGWYSFSAAYGTAPFDAGDLVGVIDADKDGTNNLTNAERYIPVEVRLDFYAMGRLVDKAVEIDAMGCVETDTSNKITAKLSADGWDSLAITEPAGDPDTWTVPQKLLWLVMRFLNRHTSDNYDGITVRKSDGTVSTKQLVTESNSVKSVGKAQ